LLRFVEPDKKLIEKGVFDMSFDPKKFKRRINNLENAREKELKPFILTYDKI